MEFRILGPLEVVDDGRPLELGGLKQRALLAVLLLEVNRVVSSERLIDALWEDEPPETAQKVLQVYISQLRKLLGKQRLETKAPGYLLRVDPDELDLARFQRLQGEGKRHEGLALWRGPPLADMAKERFAQPEIVRLEELRLACLEEQVEQDLAVGLDAELVGELEGLVREHPLRERLRCQFMLALYRSGRQAEALEIYQDARRALVEELGIEPGRALRELHQAILNQDPTLDLPARQTTPTRAEPAPEPQLPSPLESGGREARKTVTVVSVGVSIVSGRGEALDPEALRRITGRAFAEVAGAVERHGGVVETVAGEVLTAVFGLPTVHEDDAVRGVRASADVRAALAGLAAELLVEREVELGFRVGISTGEVVTGIGAASGPRTTGETVRRSSELAHAAANGEILFDEAVWPLVRDAVTADVADAGRRLIDVAGTVSVSGRRLDSPMVGRVRERRRLFDAFEQAVGDRSCQLFTVLGLAGVGKSRLVHEFLGDVTGRARVARGRCLPYGEGITFWPLREVVEELVGLDDADSPDEVRVKLAGLFSGEREADVLALRVAELIGLAEVDGSVEEGFVALRRLFETLASARPLVIVFDDIHWGEATFFDLIEHLANWMRDASILLVCIARPELLDVREDWGGGKLNATAALLEPLSDEECSQLIDNLLGRTELADKVGSRLADAAEGNPLFVEEMLSMLIDDGLLEREDGGWVATQDISTVPVPPTIHALLAARLDQLGVRERMVVECAAVAGKVFQESAMTELAPAELRPVVADALATLVRKELIRPERASLGERTYRFRHLLIRDAAYDSIAKQERAGLHERFGQWLERTSGERAIEYEEVLGYHFEQAYRYRAELDSVDTAARAIAKKAAERLGSAGRRAFLRSDAPAGVNLSSRAAKLLAPDDPIRVELVPNMRVVQGMDVDMTWADRVLTDAVEAAATTGDRRLAAHALVQRGLLRLFTALDVTPDELIDGANRSMAVFEELGNELGQGRAWRLTAQAHYLARRAGLSAAASERALSHSRRAGDRFEEREDIEWLAIALLLGPAPAIEVERACGRVRRESTTEPPAMAMLLATEAVAVAMQGRLDEGRELRAQSRAMMRELGEWIWIASFHWAHLSVWDNDPVEAERELRPGYEALKTLGVKSHFSSFAHMLSNAVYSQGRYDEAETLTHECEEASRSNDVHSQILWRSLRAKVFAQRGNHEAAGLLAREAIDFASTSDFLPAHADALMDLAEVLNLAGDVAAADAAVEEAIQTYELKGNVFAAERARARVKAHT